MALNTQIDGEVVPIQPEVVKWKQWTIRINLEWTDTGSKSVLHDIITGVVEVFFVDI